ncbi:MAG: hypothetical protein Q4D14_06960 [Bacteroidales bacterium]|nr:hypothetical protein [Bacteroidales bacterium]
MSPEIIELLKWVVPTIGIVIIAYWLIKRPIEMERIKQISKADLESSRILTPAKMAALERLTLLMQRITPEALVMRQEVGTMTSVTLHVALLTSVREEFDHNSSQQLYVSDETWEAVVQAKEAIVSAINKLASSTPVDAPAAVLAEKLISFYAALEDTPTEEAIDRIKEELKSLEHHDPNNE